MAKFWIFPQTLSKAIIWNAAGQMVNVVNAYICGEPAQKSREVIKGTALDRRFVKVPLSIPTPVGIFELVLDIEKPDSDQ